MDTEEEARAEFRRFRRKWRLKAPEALEHIRRAWERLVVFYRFPEQWWYRIRRVNLAEGLFKRARVFFRRYPGWESPEHAMQAFGIFLLGSSAYRHANRHIFEPNAFSLMPPGNLNTSS